MEEQVSRIYGIHALEEALNADMSIAKVFAQSNQQHPKVKALLNECAKQGATISYVPMEKLQKLAKGRNHQGLVANIAPVSFVSLETMIEDATSNEKAPLFLLLDQISDVRNFGAIIRSAVAAGVSGIVIQKKGGAPVNADAVKTSAGTLFKIPICKVDHIKDAIYYLQSSGIEVFAASEKTDNTIFDVNLDKPVAVIMGSEGKGVSSGILKIVDHKAKLPMQGSISSLNVSVACGAILYEIVRQRS